MALALPFICGKRVRVTEEARTYARRPITPAAHLDPTLVCVTPRPGRPRARGRSRGCPGPRGPRPGCPRGTPPCPPTSRLRSPRSEEHTSELQSRQYLVCRLLLEKKKKYILRYHMTIIVDY